MDLIMVIDDDPISSAIVRALLTPSYRVIVMKSGIQALGYCKRGPLPDLILLDEKMPSASGMEMLKALRAEEGTKGIPILFETESAEIDVAQEGYLLGASDFIVKPIIPILLTKKVEMLLRVRRLERENQTLRTALRNLTARQKTRVDARIAALEKTIE